MTDAHLPTGDKATWTGSALQIVSTVAIVGVMWGAMSKQVEPVPAIQNDVQAMAKSMVQLQGEVIRLTQALEFQTKAINSQREAALARMEARIAAAETTATNNASNMLRVWPRLRAHGENIGAIARTVERQTGVETPLKVPEDF